MALALGAGSVSCSYSISTYARFFLAAEPLAGDLPLDLTLAFVLVSSSSSLDSSPSGPSSSLLVFRLFISYDGKRESCVKFTDSSRINLTAVASSYLKVAQVALVHLVVRHKLSLPDVLQTREGVQRRPKTLDILPAVVCECAGYLIIFLLLLLILSLRLLLLRLALFVLLLQGSVEGVDWEVVDVSVLAGKSETNSQSVK